MSISKPPMKKDPEKFIKGKTKSSTAEVKQISLQMPVSLLESIDYRAKELSISRAAFIKQSCAVYLENK
jgi:hypothetical protein